jgi:hypothetical protein
VTVCMKISCIRWAKSACFGILVLFLAGGCAAPTYQKSEARIVVIRSPLLRFADLGYIRHTQNALQIQLFEAGQLVKSIDVNNFVCVDSGCLTKSMFNARYLSANYPDDILQNVFLGLPIYGGKNLQRVRGGFVQKIHTLHVEITYRVINGVIFFRDRKSGILLKVMPPPH